MSVEHLVSTVSEILEGEPGAIYETTQDARLVAIMIIDRRSNDNCARVPWTIEELREVMPNESSAVSLSLTRWRDIRANILGLMHVNDAKNKYGLSLAKPDQEEEMSFLKLYHEESYRGKTCIMGSTEDVYKSLNLGTTGDIP
ncbi:hypothetical protein PSV08DRAFT_404486 [Bipolaris maydis]|uniref:uncharacterized protein n=1 Tax=Cochliobolus heterostrophus TaxID=5016 RepID=UPI0024D350D6|nr:hypothetical protein PSV08DRAFT_404486 [Bipolaris maydis]